MYIEKSFTGKITFPISCKGILHCPNNGNKLPLIVFLPGADQLKCSNYQLSKNTIFSLLPEEMKDKFYFTVINAGGIYNTNSIYAYIYSLVEEYNIDKDRIYIVGHSYGARYAYNFAVDFPQIPAAIVSFAGYSNYIAAPKICHIPILIFHSENDPVVPIVESIRMFNALKDCGGIVERIFFKRAGHECSLSHIFSQRNIYDKLLTFKKES